MTRGLLKAQVNMIAGCLVPDPAHRLDDAKLFAEQFVPDDEVRA
jgi:hypothetical protein